MHPTLPSDLAGDSDPPRPAHHVARRVPVTLKRFVGTDRRGCDCITQTWGVKLTTLDRAQHVLSEHVVRSSHVYAIAHLLVRGGVRLASEIEPLGQAL